jgi:hypothetical protein
MLTEQITGFIEYCKVYDTWFELFNVHGSWLNSPSWLFYGP